MKRQGGFTLIELVVVIVILGILAVTAAPRFLDLQNSARTGNLDAFKASLQGASSIVYAKSAIEGVQDDDADAASTVTLDGVDIDVVFGYPAATTVNLLKILDVNTTSEWKALTTAQVSSGDDNLAYFTLFDVTVPTTGLTACYVSYTAAASAGALPTIAVTSCD